MSGQLNEEVRAAIVLARELRIPGERERNYAMARSGELVRLFRGVYLPASFWRGLGLDQQYLARVIAADLHSPGLVFSHQSAAAIWRLPSAFGWPVRPHVLQATTSSSRSNSMFIRHSVGVPDGATSIDGLLVTSLGGTVVDLAADEPFASAVVFADAALRRATHSIASLPAGGTTRDELLHQVSQLHLTQGSARARMVVEFADGRADRPGESLSRVAIARGRLTMPLLQVDLKGASGKNYTVDFYWPEHRHIGEFDGELKYSDPRFLNGRSPQQALIDEKWREDDLRASNRGFSRWGWKIASSPAKLRALLVAAGIR